MTDILNLSHSTVAELAYYVSLYIHEVLLLEAL